MRTAKTAIASIERQRTTKKKKGKKKCQGDRRDREKSDARPQWLTRTTVGRIICSSGKKNGNGRCEGEERLIFQRNCRFLPFFLSLPALPAGRVPRTNNSARYELGIYNYTGAVIGFPLFCLHLSPPLFPSFFSGNIAQFRVSLYIGKPINKSPARPTEKFPIIHRDRLSGLGRRPTKGKSESRPLDIALTGVTIVTPRPRAKWPILLKWLAEPAMAMVRRSRGHTVALLIRFLQSFPPSRSYLEITT